MTRINQLVEQLRVRPDVAVMDQEQSWIIIIIKGGDLVCEVTIPHDVLEWLASVTDLADKKEVWSDWMDYSGYDASPREKLEVQVASDILAFVDRVSTREPLLPLEIYEACQ
jgi:hypothetical protein